MSDLAHAIHLISRILAKHDISRDGLEITITVPKYMTCHYLRACMRREMDYDCFFTDPRTREAVFEDGSKTTIMGVGVKIESVEKPYPGTTFATFPDHLK